jgi:hypothetical protein
MPPINKKRLKSKGLKQFEGVCPNCQHHYTQSFATHIRRNVACMIAQLSAPNRQQEAVGVDHIDQSKLTRAREQAADELSVNYLPKMPLNLLTKDHMVKQSTGLKSVTELKVAEFIVKNNLTQTAATEMLHLLKHLNVSELQTLPKSIGTLYQRLDAKLKMNGIWEDGISFQMQKIDIPQHLQHLVGNKKYFTVPFASPTGFIKSIPSWLSWEDVILPDVIGYGYESRRPMRVHMGHTPDLHTGKALRRVTRKVRQIFRRPNLHVLGLIIYIDGATVGKGPRSATPVYITFSIACKSTRSRKEAKTVAMYIPKLWDGDLDTEGTRLVCNLAVDFLLRQFEPWCRTPFKLTFYSKVASGDVFPPHLLCVINCI